MGTDPHSWGKGTVRSAAAIGDFMVVSYEHNIIGVIDDHNVQYDN